MDNNEEYNYKNNYGDYNEPNKVSIWWGVLGFFLPFIGLILFIILNKEEHEKAKMIGIGSLIGVIASIVLPIILAIVFYSLITSYGIEGFTHKVVCYSYGLNYQPYVEDGEYYCKNKITGELEHLDFNIEGCDNGDCNIDVDEDEDDDEGIFEVYKYDIKFSNKDKLEVPYLISEGEKFEFEDDGTDTYHSLGLNNGTPYITAYGKKGISNINNIKSIHVIGYCSEDHLGSFALLSKDGDIYVSSSLCDYWTNEDGFGSFNINAFKNIKKLESKNKYKDIKQVLLNYNYYENEYDGDAIPYHFVGITTDGKMDLIEEKYDGLFEDEMLNND